VTVPVFSPAFGMLHWRLGERILLGSLCSAVVLGTLIIPLMNMPDRRYVLMVLPVL